MSVELLIDELVLDGLEGVDRHELGRALERELARLLEAGTLDPEHLQRLGPRPEVREIELSEAESASALGASAAAVLSDLLGARSPAAASTRAPAVAEPGATPSQGPPRSPSGSQP